MNKILKIYLETKGNIIEDLTNNGFRDIKELEVFLIQNQLENIKKEIGVI